MSKKIYLITGPAGVGKSTTANEFAQRLSKSAYVDGDTISHMSVAGREKPWESENASNLVWKNINDLTSNFLDDGCDVVIDWIAIWKDVKHHILNWIEQDIEVHYVVLWAEEDDHIARDKQRPEDVQMGERVMILRNEFLNSEVDSRFYLDNTDKTIESVLSTIVDDNQYIVSKLDIESDV